MLAYRGPLEPMPIVRRARLRRRVSTATPKVISDPVGVGVVLGTVVFVVGVGILGLWILRALSAPRP